MKRMCYYLLLTLVLFVAAPCAQANVLFQDDFTGIEGDAPNWDVLSGRFGAWEGIFVPGGGPTTDWTENVAAPKDLLVNTFKITFDVYTSTSSQALWWVLPHRKDANNFIRFFVNQSAEEMYWQQVVNGAWNWGENRGVVSIAGISKGSMALTMQIEGAVWSATLTDGVNSATSELDPILVDPSLYGPSRVALGFYTWGAAWAAYDNVVISEVPEPSALLALVAGVGGLIGLRRRSVR